jgi:DNA-binding NarL/FixJ family response regulator
MAEIRVLIVDDHAILRDGIRSLLERQEDIRVVGEASNGREAIERVQALAPDLVLMDVAMPEMDGLEATRQIKARFPQVRVLILTQHDDHEYVEPMLRAGASGYVLKRSGGRDVVTAIRQVYEHGAYLEPSITRQVIEGLTQPEPKEPAPVAELTQRETQVLQYLIKGKSNKEIALILGISPKTVSVHRSSLMGKLGARSSVDLLRYAARAGWFDPSDSS